MATNKLQCPYGHYYNADKFDGCPICNGGAAPPGGNAPPPAPPAPQSPAMPPSWNAPQSPGPDTRMRPGAYPQTESVFDARGANGGAQAYPSPPPPRQEAMPASPGGAQAYPSPPPAEDIPARSGVITQISRERANEDSMTMAAWSTPAGKEPVVGWLVCVKGKHYGESFSLKSGNNTVGRAINMNVQLQLEESVSRNRHCIVTYEPNSGVFYIQQGESSGLTYLNGEIVMLPAIMRKHDRARIGEAEFLLVPLCGDGFDWSDHAQ